MDVQNAVTGAIKDATNLRRVLATGLIVVGVLFYAQSNLPGAAGLRRAIGFGGSSSTA